MKKGLRIFLNIIYTIITIPFGILGAICMIPFVALGLLIFIPASIIEDIWCPNIFEKYRDQ